MSVCPPESVHRLVLVQELWLRSGQHVGLSVESVWTGSNGSGGLEQRTKQGDAEGMSEPFLMCPMLLAFRVNLGALVHIALKKFLTA